LDFCNHQTYQLSGFMIRRVLASIYCMFLFAFPSLAECGDSPVCPDVGLTDIRGMDVYGDGETLHAVLVGKLNNADGMGVAYLSSGDYGATWSKPVPVNRKGGGKVVSRRGNEAQVSVAGRRIVVAFSHSLELPNAGPMVSENPPVQPKMGNVESLFALPAAGSKPVMLAHAILVKANPEREATVTYAPDEILLIFNDSVGQEFLALAVIDPSGKRVDNHDAKLDFTDHSHLRASVPKLAPGRYTVRYRVLSADGHVVSGKYFFDVQGK